MEAHRISPLAIALALATLPVAALAADTMVLPDVHHAGCVLCGRSLKSYDPAAVERAAWQC
jgi:hypothetical protein